MSVRSLGSVVVGLCVALFAVAGCGSDGDDDGQGSECAVSEDCSDGATCVDGTCAEMPDDAGGDATADAGDAADQDTSEGDSCGDDEWDDDGECRSCLAETLECSTLLLGDPPGDSYFWSGAATMGDSIDPRIVLTLDVEPAAIESAEIEVETTTTTQVGDLPKEVTREATIDDAQLTFSFDPDQDWHDGGNPSGLEVLSVQITDICGDTGTQELGGNFTSLSTDRQYGLACPPAQ